MKQTNRRVFMMQVALGGTALAATQAMAQAMVNEKDPQAAALAYAADATKVKNPKYAAGQKCTNCALFQGKATDAAIIEGFVWHLDFERTQRPRESH